MNNQRKSGFTLIELLLVMAIIGILSALGLSIAQNAEQDALEKRTRSGIERISQLLSAKLEENFYRVLPVRINPTDVANATPENMRDFRRTMMVEFLRIEFPMTIEDTNSSLQFPQNTSIGGIAMSSMFDANTKPQQMLRFDSKLYGASATTEFQGAECLYAILSLNRDSQGSAFVETLRDREIGDLDGDGAREVLDAFGDPLNFRLVDADGNDIDTGDVKRPQDYRFVITSINLPNNATAMSSQ